MRITFIVAALDFGGGMRVIAQYAEGLRQRGHEVLVVSPAPYPYGRKARLRNALYSKTSLRTASHLDSAKVPVKILERYRPIQASDVPVADVIIATWWETAEWFASFPADRGLKIHFVQDYEIWNGEQERVDATLRLPTKKITISRWLESILVEKIGASKPAVISNGIDRTQFSQNARSFPEPPRFGFVYAPNPRKGTDIAIAAISKARETVPELQCVAFGHNQPVPEMPLPDFVDYRAAPDQEELSEIYGKCSAWLFSSREEGFGLPILEAMACGTPVIATSAGAAPELLVRGGGVVLSSTRIEEMAKQIAKFAKLDGREWAKKSDEAQNVARMHSIERAVNAFAETIENFSNVTNSKRGYNAV